MASAHVAYAIGEAWREGAQANVYHAIRAVDGRAILLKLLDAEHDSQDVERLHHEFEMGRALSGLAVAEPLALSTFEGRLALEFAEVAGSSLEWLVGSTMPMEAFLRLAVRLAGLVADIHARGVIHKDLKPGNILLDAETDAVTICNLGIAARVAREQTTLRPARLIEGSLPYMSPEQTGRMSRAIDSRSDLYSLGVTFYQLVTGRLPYEATDAVGWVHCHVARKPPPADQLRASLPRAVAELIEKLLAKVPDDRYQSASGLGHDLQRCLDEWVAHGQIAPFVLGERDVSDRFLTPQKLYGRDAETAALRDAFERVSRTGTPELVLVSGYSGIGKSAVVHELQRSIVGRNGLFVSGKFEQYRREIPYAAITQALRELALDILAERDAPIAAWKERLAAIVGTNGALIVEVVPQLGLILGPQPPVPELPPNEAEARLREVLHRLLDTCGTAEHPLVLFLDDLQWADPASLKLLGNLMSDDAHHVLIIGAHRDHEIGPSHPLVLELEQIRGRGAQVRDIVLGPLADVELAQLVADTVHASLEEAGPLARLVGDKTGGNPFFAIQFLTTLYRNGSIVFDRDALRWRWDVARIEAEDYTDNVVELMVDKLRDLPPQTQEVVTLAACIGASVDAEMLAIVHGRDPAPALREALAQDLLVRVGHSYRFSHDRVHEAAYSLTSPDRRGEIHLRIGRALLANLSANAIDEHVFDIASQLDRGAACLVERDEKLRVAEIELRAGRAAKASTAYASACVYLAAGMALLDDDCWVDHYALAFGLWFEAASCQLLCGNFETVQQLISGLLSKTAASTCDAAAVYRLKIDLHVMRSENPDAVASALACLRLFAIDLPAHPTWAQVQLEYDAVWRNLGARSIESLIDAPRVTDAELQAPMDVLAVLHPPAFNTDLNLVYLLLCRLVNLSLAHGTAPSSTYGYAFFGMILGPVFHRYGDGDRFARLACELVEKHAFLAYKAKVYLALEIVVLWTQPVSIGIDVVRTAARTAVEIGDLAFACYSWIHTLSGLLVRGDPLDSVLRESEKGLDVARKLRFADVADAMVGHQRFIATMQGRTATMSTFGAADFDEAAFEARPTGNRMVQVFGWYWVLKLKACVIAGDHARALAAAQRAKPHLWGLACQIPLLDYYYYTALATAARYDQATADEQLEARALLAAHGEQLREWAAVNPGTFHDKHALVAAELARVEGRELDAERGYEEAIRWAHDNGFVHHEALAYETAARFYHARGQELFSDAYLERARDRYGTWGAAGKVRELERLHPGLLGRSASAAAATVAVRADQLDLLAVTRASQTISGATVPEQVLRTLLQLVLEHGGARRARLILVPGGEPAAPLQVTAEAAVDELAALATAPGVPESILRYVERTQEHVLLADAVADAGRFATDPYFAHARARSVLCLPIRRQAEVVALLYLENDLVPGAFTAERMVSLDLLATQTAISFQNALLLEREHEARVEAEADKRRALLLGDATEAISSTADYQGVFGALARLCTHWFADWALIDFDNAGTLVRLASAHRDPGQEPLLRELAERYPPDPGGARPAGAVLRSRMPIYLPELPAAVLRQYLVDDGHVELVRRLGAGSSITVPLVARDASVGVLTLVATSPNAYSPADVALAAELGRRAALAIDNVRLLDQTRRALHLRDDFLTVASHELRTPLSALRLTVEYLVRAAATHRSVSSDTMNSCLARLLSRTERLEQLAGELLDATKIEAGPPDLRRTTVELGALVREVVSRLGGELATACCEVTVDCPVPVVGMWDASRLGDVMTTLLANAIKFGVGRPIEIGVYQSDGLARISVRDHGIGIDPVGRSSVFERFARAVSARSYGGLGLGLYIARWIVVGHGGTIDVESELGAGSTFTVALPSAQPSG